MIELLPQSGPGLIAIRMSGMISIADQEKSFPQADTLFDQERPECVLLDWEHLDGWEKGARTLGTWFGMHHRATIAKVAIIGEDRWADDTLRITDVFRSAEVRRFPPAERDRAMHWLGAA